MHRDCFVVSMTIHLLEWREDNLISSQLYYHCNTKSYSLIYTRLESNAIQYTIFCTNQVKYLWISSHHKRKTYLSQCYCIYIQKHQKKWALLELFLRLIFDMDQIVFHIVCLSFLSSTKVIKKEFGKVMLIIIWLCSKKQLLCSKKQLLCIDSMARTGTDRINQTNR